MVPSQDQLSHTKRMAFLELFRVAQITLLVQNILEITALPESKVLRANTRMLWRLPVLSVYAGDPRYKLSVAKMTRFRSLTGCYSRYRLNTYVAALNSTIVASENTATRSHDSTLAHKIATSGISRDCDVKRTISID